MHEPLVIGIYLPTFEFQPWFLKGTELVTKFERNIRIAYKTDSEVVDLLASLFEISALIPTVSSEAVKKLLLT